MDYSKFKQLEFRRKFLVLVGAEINVINPADESVIGFIKMKAWKLREDVRLYTDRSMITEVIRIHARNIIDFGATYDIFDSSNDQLLFSLRRKGLRSTFVRDHWELKDAQDNLYADIQETSSGLAIGRRYLEIIPYIGGIISLIFAFIPQTYAINNVSSGTPVLAGKIIHRKNPFIVKMSFDTRNMPAPLDARANLAIVAMLSVIDATKNN